jgi:hypothetical protein
VRFFGYIDFTTEDTPRPFYVGIGDAGRLRKQSRNKKHGHVLKKHGFNRRTVTHFDEWSSACEWEKLTIKEQGTLHYNNPNGIGCNFTMGGDGFAGGHHTEGTRRAASERMRGKRYSLGRTQSPEERQRRSDALKGRPLSEEHRRKLSAAAKTGLKNKSKGTRKPLSPETKAKISIANMGNHSAAGNRHSDETKRKMSEARQARPYKPLSDTHKQNLSEAMKNSWSKRIPER